MRKILLPVGLIATFAAGWFCHKPASVLSTELQIDTLLIHDTVAIRSPRVVTERALPPRTIVIPGDTIHDTILLPAVSRHYSSGQYDAYISGIDPRLDSLFIHTPSTIITRTVTQPARSRWHLGVSAGAAVTPKGLQPYVGVGITYSLFAF